MVDEATIRIGGRHPAQLFIRQWIKYRDLDQKRVAGRMEVEPGTVSKLLSGKLKMTIYYLAGFADALETSVPELFRDPTRPSREELLRGFSDQELTTALQLIVHSREQTAKAVDAVVSFEHEPRPAERPQLRTAGRRK